MDQNRLISALDILEEEKRKKFEYNGSKGEAKIMELIDKVTNKIKLAEMFYDFLPYFFDKADNFWFWDWEKRVYVLYDETDFFNLIEKTTMINTLRGNERSEMINAFKIIGRRKFPQENKATWIQFNKEIVDIETGDSFAAMPKYFLSNSLPHWRSASPRLHSDIEKFDLLFEQWVGKDNVRILYEILAFCLIPKYFIERIIVLHGAGSNGKSCFLQLLRNLLGKDNVCTSSLELITHGRFETAKFYKKSAILMSETNMSALESSDKIKILTSGKDTIPAEYKHKGHIDFINYGKLIIATNNLPPTEDKTDGFYRRFLILDFPNQFSDDNKNPIDSLSIRDYENLATYLLPIADDLWHKQRKFTNEGDIADRRKRYEERSNPFDKFWKEYVDDSNPDSDIPCWEMIKECNAYMKANHLRELTDIAIGKLMRDKNVEKRVLIKDWYENDSASKKAFKCWLGIAWKK